MLKFKKNNSGAKRLKCIFKKWTEGGMDWIALAENRDR